MSGIHSDVHGSRTLGGWIPAPLRRDAGMTQAKNMEKQLSISELEKKMRPGACSGGGFLGPTESLEAVIEQDSATLAKSGFSHAQIADALESVLQAAQDQRGAQLAELARILESERPKPGKLRTALELAQQSILASRDKSSELAAAAFERRDVQIPDLYHPKSIPSLSLNNLPDVNTGYLVDGGLQVFFAQYRGLQDCPWNCDYDRWAYFDFLILNRRSGAYVTGPGLIVHLIREHHFFEGLESPYRVEPAQAIQVLGLASAASSLVGARRPDLQIQKEDSVKPEAY